MASEGCARQDTGDSDMATAVIKGLIADTVNSAEEIGG